MTISHHFRSPKIHEPEYSLRGSYYSIDRQQCQIEIEHPVKQAVQFGLITNCSGQRGFTICLIDNSQWGEPIDPSFIQVTMYSDLVNR